MPAHATRSFFRVDTGTLCEKAVAAPSIGHDLCAVGRNIRRSFRVGQLARTRSACGPFFLTRETNGRTGSSRTASAKGAACPRASRTAPPSRSRSPPRTRNLPSSFGTLVPIKRREVRVPSPSRGRPFRGFWPGRPLPLLVGPGRPENTKDGPVPGPGTVTRSRTSLRCTGPRRQGGRNPGTEIHTSLPLFLCVQVPDKEGVFAPETLERQVLLGEPVGRVRSCVHWERKRGERRQTIRRLHCRRRAGHQRQPGRQEDRRRHRPADSAATRESAPPACLNIFSKFKRIVGGSHGPGRLSPPLHF